MSLEAFETTWEHERRGYIRCRTMGHAWFDVDSTWVPAFGTPLTFHCERCGSERRDIIDINGDLASRSYIKPHGYDLEKGSDRPTRSDFRLMLNAIRQQGDTASRRIKYRASA